MTKYGTWMDKNFLPSVGNILMSWSSQIIFKKILLTCNIKMESSCQLMTLPIISDTNSLKQSEKVLMKSTAFWQDLKVMNQDFIGLIISELLSN